jgi:hypothetical protein
MVDQLLDEAPGTVQCWEDFLRVKENLSRGALVQWSDGAWVWTACLPATARACLSAGLPPCTSVYVAVG